MTNDQLFKFQSSIQPVQELIDFSTMRRSGTVELIPIHDYKHKDNHFSFRCFRGYVSQDKMEKVWIGIPIELNPNGTYKFQKIEVRNRRLFTLANEQDAKEWHVVQHHFNVAGSLNAGAITNFKVFDANIEAEKEIAKFNISLMAGEIVRNMSVSKMQSFGRLFSLDPLINSDMVIKAKLLEVCMKEPQKILDANRNTDFTNVKEVFYRALSFAEITRDVQRGYMFRHQPLGYTVDAAVIEMMKDMKLVHVLDQMSKEKEKIALATARQYDEVSSTMPIIIPESAEPTSEAPLVNQAEMDAGMTDAPPILPVQKGRKGKVPALSAEQAMAKLAESELASTDTEF
jgi:hypothetical protein